MAVKQVEEHRMKIFENRVLKKYFNLNGRMEKVRSFEDGCLLGCSAV
jgi:hypothetical protein